MKIIYGITQRFMWLVAQPLFWFIGLELGVSVEVHDEFNIKKTACSPIIIASNHKGIMDMVYIVGQFPFFSSVFPLMFLSEVRHFKTPMLNFFRKIGVIGLIYNLGGAFPSGRGLGVERATDHPVSLLKKRTSIFIFPEGERIFEDELGTFYRGAAAMAIKSGVPILPVSFRPYIGENGKKKIVIRYGALLELKRPLSYEEGTRILKETIQEMYFQIS